MTDTFLFCGTGAADYAAPEEGKEFRKNTHSLLNDIILLDIGGMTYRFEDDAVLRARFAKVRHVLVTHTHSDHFSPQALERLAEDNGQICVYIDANAISLVPQNAHITVVPVSDGQTVRFDGYTVHVLSSNHQGDLPEEHTHHYAVDTPSGKTLFYGLDGAWLKMDVGQFLMQHPADLMILDATSGVPNDYRSFEHNTVAMLRVLVSAIRANKMIKPDGVIFADHLARTLYPGHTAASALLSEIGMQTAYDGLCIEF